MRRTRLRRTRLRRTRLRRTRLRRTRLRRTRLRRTRLRRTRLRRTRLRRTRLRRTRLRRTRLLPRVDTRTTAPGRRWPICSPPWEPTLESRGGDGAPRTELERVWLARGNGSERSVPGHVAEQFGHLDVECICESEHRVESRVARALAAIGIT
ncbi:pentapeptide repeat-containing protein [Nakamurella sp. A5-74]|uniref:Pentapeptide repeat-containing protein n=1 Tax=Nakamurella sp. A5-74 TaxID=3158264 RepID=A0AAU8DUS8_9ACTN